MTDSVNAKKPQKTRRMVQLRYVLMPFAIIFAALVVLMAMGAMAPKPVKKPIKIKAPLVAVMKLEHQDVAFSISSQGSVLPRTETNIISEVSGNVVSVSEKFQVGGFFKKGEELLRIDDITYQVAFLKAESRLESAVAELEQEKARVKQAKDEWLLTGKSLEKAPTLALRLPQLKQAKASIKSAEADLTEAKTKLERTRIIAPYDAMIKAKQVDVGQYASTGSSIATTFAVDYAEVRLPVKQRDIAFLNLPKINQDAAKGSNVELFFKIDGKKQHWASKLTRYEGVVDMTSRVHYVVAQLDDPYGIIEGNQAGELRMGTFVNADITGKTVQNALAIPRRAIHGANTVYLVDEKNKLHINEIDILRAEVEYVYTLQNLPENQRLVITNIETPVEGMTLRIDGEEVIEEQTAEVNRNGDTLEVDEASTEAPQTNSENTEGDKS